MNSELKKLSSWLAINKLTLNIDKCIYILFNVRNIHSSNTLPIFLNEIPIKHVLNYKFLGVCIDDKLDWKQQYGYVTSKLCRVIGIIKKLNINLNLNTRILIFKSLFMSHLNYCSHIWGNTFKTNKSYIAILQERALKCIILNTNINIHDFMQSNFILSLMILLYLILYNLYIEASIINYRLICKSDLLKIKIIVINLLERHLERLETYFV